MKVSIIVPCYNRESTIKECIDSILNQSFEGELEIIVCDDGSSDDTISEVKKYENKVILLLKPTDCVDQGASYARNRGLKIATGDIIGFLDSDDYFLPNYLTTAIKEFEDNRIGYTFARAKKELITVKGNKSLVPWTRDKMNRLDLEYHVLFRAYNINTNVILFRRSLLDIVGYFDTTLTNGEDSDMWIKISENAKGKFVDFYGAVYRIDHSENQLSKNLADVKKKCANILYANAFARTISDFPQVDKLRLLIIIRNIMLINVRSTSIIGKLISKGAIYFKIMILYPCSFIKFCIYGITNK